MPNNLTPEQLAALRAFYARNASGYTPELMQGGDGTTYQQFMDNSGPSGEAGNGQGNNLQGYLNYGSTNVGDNYNQYGANGDFQQTGQFQEVNALKDFMVPFLATMGMQFLPGGAFAGSGAAGAGGVSGLADGSALDAMYGGLDGGATLGGGASVNGGAALGTGAAAGGAGLGSAGAGLASGAGAGLGANSELALGSMGNAAAMGAGAGGLLSGLGGSGLGTALGAIATAAGAASGAKGTEQTTTTNKQLPDYLKGPVQDLINRSQGLLATQMPIAAQQGQQLRTVGQGLLNSPIAGNGFQMFAQRRGY